MNTRNDFPGIGVEDMNETDMDVELFHAGEEEYIDVEFNEDANKPGDNELLHSGIDISFEVKNDHTPYVHSLDDIDIILKFTLAYDNTKSQKKAIETIFNFDHNNMADGILSDVSRSAKFNIQDFDDYYDFNAVSTRIVVNDKEILKIAFELPHSNTDHLLQLLSILNDTIKILLINNVDIRFTIFDIIKVLADEYKKINHADCPSAVILNQLIAINSSNSGLLHDDVISLIYCFSALKLFDLSLFAVPKDLTMLNNEIISTIDKLFLSKFTKNSGNPLTDEEYQTAINTERKQELNEFLKRVHLWQRIKLYNPCLGKPASDGGVYLWDYTEWDFFRDTNFVLDKNGDMYTDISLETNPDSGYSQHYAINKNQHGNFATDLKTIAPHIDLSFREMVEWHNKIVFTPECAQRLFDMKLHFDINNVKKLLKARNNYRFFQQAYQEGTKFKENLLEEVVKLICTLAYGPLLAPEDLYLPKHQYPALR